MTGVTLAWVAPDDPVMSRVNELRYEVLFRPYGVPRDDGWDDGGEDRKHLVAFSGDAVVGYTCLLLPGDGTGHLRQVSVRVDLQRSGVGRALMREAEDEARRMGLASLWLNARVLAEGFYHRCGFETTSTTFPSGRTGLPHVRMEKTL